MLERVAADGRGFTNITVNENTNGTVGSQMQLTVQAHDLLECSLT
jgi:hypothetical protein